MAIVVIKNIQTKPIWFSFGKRLKATIYLERFETLNECEEFLQAVKADGTLLRLDTEPLRVTGEFTIEQLTYFKLKYH